MTDAIPPAPEPLGSTRDRLAELAGLLQRVDHLEADERDGLARVVAELDAALHGPADPEVIDRLASHTEELVHALRDRQGAGLADAAHRARDTATRLEADESGDLSPALAVFVNALNTLGI